MSRDNYNLLFSKPLIRSIILKRFNMSATSSDKPKVNLRSTAVKRIMQEASEFANPEEDDFIAAPLEVNMAR